MGATISFVSASLPALSSPTRSSFSQRQGLIIRHDATAQSCILPLFCSTTYIQHNKYQTHLDVLLRILQIIKKCIFSPHNTTLLIGTRVRISIRLSRLTSPESVEVGSLLVSSATFDSVALRAFGLEDLGSLLFVSWFGHLETLLVECENEYRVASNSNKNESCVFNAAGKEQTGLPLASEM
jgi:hypothetical protein